MKVLRRKREINPMRRAHNSSFFKDGESEKSTKVTKSGAKIHCTECNQRFQSPTSPCSGKAT